jgi:hypothetical protein
VFIKKSFWYICLVSLLISLLFNINHITYFFSPNFGGDSNRLYLYYFSDYKNISHNILSFFSPNDLINLYSHQRFFIDVNLLLNQIFSNIYLYHLNNLLPFFLCTFSIINIVNNIFRNYEIFEKNLISINICIFYLANKYTLLNITNAGIWSHAYFLFPFFIYLFLSYCEVKKTFILVIFFFSILYFQFFDIGNIGFIISYLLLFIFFCFIFRDFFLNNIKNIFIFLFIILIGNINYIYQIIINISELNYLKNADQTFYLSSASNFERGALYLKSYIHTVNYGNLLLRLSDLKLDIISNNPFSLNNFVHYVLNYFFLLLIFLIILFVIIKNILFPKYYNKEIIKLFMILLLFSFLSSPNINNFLLDNFLQIFHTPISSSFRSVNIKFFLGFNAIYTIILIIVLLIITKYKKGLFKILISLIALTNLFFIYSLNLEDKTNKQFSNYISYGLFHEDFEFKIKNICKDNNYNILSFPISNSNFFFKIDNKNKYNSYSPLPLFCDRYHFYNLSNTNITKELIDGLYNKDEKKISDILVNNNLGIILVYKNLTRDDLSNFPEPFNNLTGNYNIQYFIDFLSKKNFKKIHEDKNFFYFKGTLNNREPANIKKLNRYAYLVENTSDPLQKLKEENLYPFIKLTYWSYTDNLFIKKFIFNYFNLKIKTNEYDKNFIIFYYPYFFSELVYFFTIFLFLIFLYYALLKKK